MKIIVKREEHILQPKQLKCCKCKSDLEYEQHDLKNDRDGKYIECPVCNQFNAV